MTESTYAIVLAAGKGTRMKSELPKVLSQLSGKPLLIHVLEKIEKAGVNNLVIVVGYGREQVEKCVNEWAQNKEHLQIQYALQENQNGTGHAVMMADGLIPKDESKVAVLLGDVPMIESETIEASIAFLKEENAAATVVSMKLKDPSGYGRILRDELNHIIGIREEKDASESEKKVNEVNSGIFIFNSKLLWQALNQVTDSNAQGEYYITDTIEILKNMNEKVTAYLSDNADQFRGINSPEQLQELSQLIG